MESFKQLFKVLDEIRIYRNVSVENLCDGIISERTYYRYLKSDRQIRYNVFNQLVHRLGVDAQDLIYFSIFTREGDPSISRFIYRVHTKDYHDIKEIYEKVKQQLPDHKILSSLLRASISKYEYSMDLISSQEHDSQLRKIIDEISDIKMPNILAIMVYSIYYSEFPSRIESLNKEFLTLVDYLLSCDETDGMIFLGCSLDNFLRVILDSKLKAMVENKKYYQLVKLFQRMIDKWPHRFFHMRYFLYHAYELKTNGKQRETESMLVKFLSSLILMVGGDAYDKEITVVKRLFDIEPILFLKNQCSSILMDDDVVLRLNPEKAD